MSKITVESFLRLHEKQLENIEYKSGYDYAKRCLLNVWKGMSMMELFSLLRCFREDGFEQRNYYAIGQSQLVLEIISERLEGNVASVSY